MEWVLYTLQLVPPEPWLPRRTSILFLRVTQKSGTYIHALNIRMQIRPPKVLLRTNILQHLCLHRHVQQSFTTGSCHSKIHISPYLVQPTCFLQTWWAFTLNCEHIHVFSLPHSLLKACFYVLQTVHTDSFPPSSVKTSVSSKLIFYFLLDVVATS